MQKARLPYIPLRDILLFLMIIASPEVVLARIAKRDNTSSLMFCKSDFGVMQSLDTDYGSFASAFFSEYGWANHFYSRSATDYYVVFSAYGESSDAEKIFYDVEPYGGGIALTHMHIRLNGTFENLSGSKMCRKTVDIMNAR